MEVSTRPAPLQRHWPISAAEQAFKWYPTSPLGGTDILTRDSSEMFTTASADCVVYRGGHRARSSAKMAPGQTTLFPASEARFSACLGRWQCGLRRVIGGMTRAHEFDLEVSPLETHTVRPGLVGTSDREKSPLLLLVDRTASHCTCSYGARTFCLTSLDCVQVVSCAVQLDTIFGSLTKTHLLIGGRNADMLL